MTNIPSKLEYIPTFNLDQNLSSSSMIKDLITKVTIVHGQERIALSPKYP